MAAYGGSAAASFVHRVPGMVLVNVGEFQPGSLVGSYRILREIGRGGMSVVYEAVHAVLPRRAALKVLHSELRHQHGMTSRMLQEASILEEIRHPGVVRIFECGVLGDGRPCIAMELVEGDTLAARLHRMTVLSPLEVAALLAEVSDVLAAVHARGVVHRDLKPDNLLLTPTDRDFPLRVIDWGVARLGPQGRLTLDGLTPGTPIYMSPEQATGRNIAAPCDIYSLGVTAYEALAGHPPFDGRTLAEVVCMHLTTEAEPLHERCDAPDALCALIHRMLEKTPARRPSAGEIRQRMRALAADLAVGPYESFEVAGVQPAPTPAAPAARARRERARPTAYIPFVPSSEIAVIDTEELERSRTDHLELCRTEVLSIPRRPRWTPELSQIIPSPDQAGVLAQPPAERADAAGEVVQLLRPPGRA